MSGAHPSRGSGPNSRPLLAKDILIAQEHTQSAAQAARYLNVNYATYRKYAMLYDLFKNHTNKTGKGIPRKKMKGLFGLDAILAGEHPTYDRGKLKERIIRAGKLPERCNLCGFDEKRIFDGRCPLVLHSKDGDNHNLRLENLELRCYNCFTGPETFLTPTGIRSFADTVNTTQQVLTSAGTWESAHIVQYGTQPIQRVTVKPAAEQYGRSKTALRYTIDCTPNHRWITNTRGEVTDLQVGDIIPFQSSIHDYILEAWIRGFGFGDGTIGSENRAQIRLCAKKDHEQLHRFIEYGHCSVSYPPSSCGDPVIMFHTGYFSNWKELPTIDHTSCYLRSWLDGYLAADGSRLKSGGWQLSSQNRLAIEFVRSIAARVGYMVTGNHVHNNMETNLGKRKAPLQSILLHSRGVFKVMAVECLHTEQPVFCAVEPVTHSFVLGNGMLTGNCSYLTTGTVSAKSEMKKPLNEGVFDNDLMETQELSPEELERLKDEMWANDEDE